jgi:hypothetical protein
MNRLGSVVLVTLALLVGAPSAHAKFVERGSGLTGAGDGALVCSYFAQSGRAARPRAHGFVCGLLNGFPTPAAGPSLVGVLTRSGRIRCAESGSLTVEGTFGSGLQVKLGGQRCGVGTFADRYSGGNGRAASQHDPEVPGNAAEVGGAEAVGRRLRRGGLSCVVLTSADWRRYDPTGAARDAFFCARRADQRQNDGSIFENGSFGAPCQLSIDATTGCGTARCGSLPDIPVCL